MGKVQIKVENIEACKLKFHSTSTLLIVICPSLASWLTLHEPFTLRCKSLSMVRSSFLSTIITTTQFLSHASIVYSFPLFFFSLSNHFSYCPSPHSLSLVLCHPSASEPEVPVAIWMIWSKRERGNSLAVYLRASATCGAWTLFY